MSKIEYSLMINSPSSYFLCDKDINYDKLRKEAENYCKKVNKDLRIYMLGLFLSYESEKNIFKFLRIFNTISNFNNIWSKFTLEMLNNEDYGCINYCKNFSNEEKEIQNIINLLEIHGDNIPRYAARSAAYVASAAESAEWNVRSAAEAAEAYAAESAASAAESAEWNVRSAKYASESAMRSVKRSADSAAWSAASAEESEVWSEMKSAESEAYVNMYNALINLMTEKVGNNE